MLLTFQWPGCEFSRMLLITTALMMEARPLVKRLALKALPDLPFPVFEGSGYRLIVTGTGNLKMAGATGWALGYFPGPEAALNIGFCGQPTALGPLHKWYYVSSVRDSVTNRLSLPDILQNHPFQEQSLLTVPSVVRSPGDYESLIDMEASGFYESARRHLAPDRIALLKWSSDFLTGSIDKDVTAAAFSKGLDPVVDFLREWPEAFAPLSSESDPADDILNCLRLTRTQELFLRKWISGYIARKGDPLRLHKLIPESPLRSKKANTQLFEQLKDVLKS